MTIDQAGPLLVVTGILLAIWLVGLWCVWAFQYLLEMLCDLLNAMLGKEDPGGPYH